MLRCVRALRGEFAKAEETFYLLQRVVFPWAQQVIALLLPPSRCQKEDKLAWDVQEEAMQKCDLFTVMEQEPSKIILQSFIRALRSAWAEF